MESSPTSACARRSARGRRRAHLCELHQHGGGALGVAPASTRTAGARPGEQGVAIQGRITGEPSIRKSAEPWSPVLPRSHC